MANYGTREYYEQELEKDYHKKAVLDLALKMCVMTNADEEDLFDYITSELYVVKTSIKYNSEKIAELKKKEQE